jgi:hypothetical protein
MNELLKYLIDNIRSVDAEFTLTKQEKEAIRKSLVEEYVDTVKQNRLMKE